MSTRQPRGITVAHLRMVLADLPDDTPVVVGGPDHSCERVYAALVTTAIEYGRGNLSEDHGYETQAGERRIQILYLHD